MKFEKICNWGLFEKPKRVEGGTKLGDKSPKEKLPLPDSRGKRDKERDEERGGREEDFVDIHSRVLESGPDRPEKSEKNGSSREEKPGLKWPNDKVEISKEARRLKRLADKGEKGMEGFEK